jgi:hypothetical protein
MTSEHHRRRSSLAVTKQGQQISLPSVAGPLAAVERVSAVHQPLAPSRYDGRAVGHQWRSTSQTPQAVPRVIVDVAPSADRKGELAPDVARRRWVARVGSWRPPGVADSVRVAASDPAAEWGVPVLRANQMTHRAAVLGVAVLLAGSAGAFMAANPALAVAGCQAGTIEVTNNLDGAVPPPGSLRAAFAAASAAVVPQTICVATTVVGPITLTTAGGGELVYDAVTSPDLTLQGNGVTIQAAPTRGSSTTSPPARCDLAASRSPVATPPPLAAVSTPSGT